MSKLAASVQATFCSTLVDEWVRAGVRDAVLAPGSRSTPMALALAADERIRLQVRLDERSAGFVAVGIALASGIPVIVLTTSGTAAAELHASVVEAHQSLVPLIVCTADRPPELQAVGAPQTIAQVGLFGSAVRFAPNLEVPTESGRDLWRSLAARVFLEATASPLGPGPVHLNLPFREPLEGEPGDLPPGRRDGAPWHSVLSLPGQAPTLSGELSSLVERAERPLLVVGARGGGASSLLAAAGKLGWPVLADPRSGCRLAGPRAAGATVVAAADSLLRAGSFVSAHEPDLVVRLGEAWSSKVLNTWLNQTASSGIPHLLVDPFGEWRDPGHDVAAILRARPEAVIGALEGAASPLADEGWAASWASAEQSAQEAIEAFLGRLAAADELSEPQIARSLATQGAIGTLVVSSSMPVRDLEWFSAAGEDYPRVLANRGANGIDGVASTAIGAATAGVSGPVVGLLGDLAFLHDLTALVRPLAGRHGEGGAGCGFVVVDNGGGGIFSYLPQASSVANERFERLFGTPQANDVAEMARGAGAAVTEVAKASELAAGLDELLRAIGEGRPVGQEAPAVLVCRTDRQRSVAIHNELNEEVAAALQAR